MFFGGFWGFLGNLTNFLQFSYKILQKISEQVVGIKRGVFCTVEMGVL